MESQFFESGSFRDPLTGSTGWILKVLQMQKILHSSVIPLRIIQVDGLSWVKRGLFVTSVFCRQARIQRADMGFFYLDSSYTEYCSRYNLF